MADMVPRPRVEVLPPEESQLSLRRIARSWRTPLVIAGGSVLWEIVWGTVMLLGPQVGFEVGMVPSLIFWGWIALALSTGITLLGLVRENYLLKAEKQPKFEIVFEPDERAYPDSCPYRQVLEFVARRHPSGPDRPMRDHRYRVGIVNLSSAIVPNVRVVLADCELRGNYVHLGHTLLVMDSDPPAAERDLHPSPDGKPTLYFDVVAECGNRNETPKYFEFVYANPNIRGPVGYELLANEDHSYEITLRAEGAGYSCSRSFRVSKGFENHQVKNLRMELL